MRNLSAALLALPLLFVAACGNGADDIEADPLWATISDAGIPAARWDHLPDGKDWSRSAMAELIVDAGRPLIQMVPDDIDEWCPSYADGSGMDRAAFWSGLLSAMAKHESTYNPQAVGGGGQWFGLVQISPATAQGYGCRATTGEALKEPAANLSCAIRIMAHTVPRDGVVAAGMRGVAADWGPFHSASKRADMAAWTTQQSYCQ